MTSVKLQNSSQNNQFINCRLNKQREVFTTFEKFNIFPKLVKFN
jgi:hypothetical protein